MDEWMTGLKAQIIDKKDAENFDDLIKCHQNGLLRAGFLLSWLMLIESLKRKIVDLANKGVKVAVSELKTITTTEDAMHSNDEVIWKGALKCDLITKEEDSVLEMLWRKRCIMSHPYMPEVSESDFRYIVENLISMSLSRSLMWSKSMIEEYFEDIKNNAFLIPDESEEKKDEADRVIALIPGRLRPFFWKTLFYELSLSLENGKKKHLMMLRVLATSFVKLDSVDINDDGYTLASQIKNHCDVCWNVFFNKRAWRKLNEEYQAQLFRYLKDDKKGAKKVLWLAKGLLEHEDDLDDKYIDCYYEALAQFDVTDMQGYYLDKKRFLKLLYEDKIKDYQFSDQGDFIDMLSSMDESDIDEFTASQLQKIGKYVEMCCINGTFKAQDFVKRRNIWSENLNYAKGVAIEGCTDEKGNLRFSKRHLEYVMPVLYHTKAENRVKVIEALDELPVLETLHERLLSSILKTEVKRYFEEESEEGKALLALVDKYCKA